MNTRIEATGSSQGTVRTGWILSGIVIAFMVGDASATLLAITPVKSATLETGWQLSELGVIGAIQVLCLVLYSIPTTSVLGAIVFTGFLGGAIATHLRVAGTMDPEMIVSLVVGILAWGGLWFRNPALRSLIPLRH